MNPPPPEQPSLFAELPSTQAKPGPLPGSAAESRAAQASPGSNEVHPDHEPDSPELARWKTALRQDFERWLDSIEAVPDDFGDGQPGTGDAESAARAEEPDLYSLHEQLVAANAESRKANRRTAEAISQWGQVLTRFEEGLGPLRETTAQLAAAQPRSGSLSRTHCLALAEVLDRLHRLAQAFESPPPAEKNWWGGRTRSVDAWRQAWETQRQGLDILVGHLEALLAKEGVSRLETTGRPFDPTVMMAVATEPDATRPPQTVLEELAAGYRWHDELLRAAQVKVSRPL